MSQRPRNARLHRMGGANGLRECAPDDRLRDTQSLVVYACDGYREGLRNYYLARKVARIDHAVEGESISRLQVYKRPSAPEIDGQGDVLVRDQPPIVDAAAARGRTQP